VAGKIRSSCESGQSVRTRNGPVSFWDVR